METKEKTGDLHCPLCSFRPASQGKSVLRRHINAVHLNIRHQCDLCLDTFSQACTLRRHVKQMHPDSLERFRCDRMCGRVYGNEQALRMHECKVDQSMCKPKTGTSEAQPNQNQRK